MLKRLLPAPRRTTAAFTLIELLTVIAIIAILAALLLSSIYRAKLNAQRGVCRTEEVNLVGAIEQYFATYSHLPTSTNAVAAVAGTTNDFTFGTAFNTAKQLTNLPTITGASAGIITLTLNETKHQYQNNNSELMAILRDDNFPPEYETSGSQVRAHIYNPNHDVLFQPKAIAPGVVPAGDAQWAPGLGSDEILRDPWGLPYMVTVDLSMDDRVLDPYLNMMYQAQFGANLNLYTPGHAVVWSLGPFFKQINLNKPANNTVNKYMVISSQ
jgi:prepilin-type N-terminal cleavage/methylation domain-containing protein